MRKKKTVVVYEGSTKERLTKPHVPPTAVDLYRVLISLLADQEGVVINYQIVDVVDDE